MCVSVHTSESGIADVGRDFVHTENRAVDTVIPHLKCREDIVVSVELSVKDLGSGDELGVGLLKQKCLWQFEAEDGGVQPEVQRRKPDAACEKR